MGCGTVCVGGGVGDRSGGGGVGDRSGGGPRAKPILL